MDRGAWRATVQGVTKLDMTEAVSTHTFEGLHKNQALVTDDKTSIICKTDNSSKVEIINWPSTGKWINKMWSIHTMK